MKKKELMRITPKEPTARMIEIAADDKYINRIRETEHFAYVPGKGYVPEKTYYKIKSYGTRNYITAKEEKGILVIAVYLRNAMAAGEKEPYLTTYIDKAAEKWISRFSGVWSEAYTYRIIWDMRGTVINKTDYGIAKDVYEQEDLELCERILGTETGDMIKSVDEWQEQVRKKENKKKAERKAKHWKEQMDLIPPLPDDFEHWARDEGTIDSNFIFYRRKGNKTKAYCTHCGKNFETAHKMVHNPGNPTEYTYKPNYKYFCPECGAYLASKAWGKGGRLSTNDRVAIMQRAGEDIVFRGFKVKKVFWRENAFPYGEKWKCATNIFEDIRIIADRYTFCSKESYMLRDVPNVEGGMIWATAMESGYYGLAIPYTRNMNKELEGTGVRPVVANLFTRGSQAIQQALMKASRKGYVEYLLKAGLSRLANEVVESYGAVVADESAKNLKDLLGLDGQQLYTLKQVNGNSCAVKALEYVKNHNEKISDEALRYMSLMKISPENLHMARTGMTLQRTVNYLRRQAETNSRSFESTNAMYRDYLNMAQARGMDLTDDIVRHTSRLKEMHDRYLEEKNAAELSKETTRVDRKFKKIAEEYLINRDHFAYEKAGLVILVPHRASDITREGKAQHHCVGASDRYMRNMNEGKSYILFLRKAEDPGEPYYTLEVNYDGKVLQSYGAYDRKPDWDKVEPVLTGFTRKIAQRTIKEQQAVGQAV